MGKKLFTELKLKPKLLEGIQKTGFKELTPIQEKTYEPIVQGKDVLGLAKTGSGKTSACAIPILQNVEEERKEVQAVILVPTRELALQYADEIDKVSACMDIRVLTVYGGMPIREQQQDLKMGPQVLVATPGRLIDHIYSSEISFKSVKTFVLDEADEMLNMGFIEDIEFILSCIRTEHQTLLFSATMPKEIEELTKHHLNDPVKVKLLAEETVPAEIDHYFFRTSRKYKLRNTVDFLKNNPFEQVIIFCNSRHAVEDLAQQLKRDVKRLECIHGGLPQPRRTSIFERVKKKSIRVLIATDVAGRGLDFSHVTHVINYDFPREVENFAHRTGRTGRMGKRGDSLSFISKRDEAQLKKVLDYTGIDGVWLDELLIPRQDQVKKDSKPKRDQFKDRKRDQNREKKRDRGADESEGSSRNKKRNSRRTPGSMENSNEPSRERKRTRKRKNSSPGLKEKPTQLHKEQVLEKPIMRDKNSMFTSIKNSAKKLWDKLFW